MAKRTLYVQLVAALALSLAAGTLTAQTAGDGAGGTLERIRVHGPALEGNLEGDDPTRDVVVYLPPSYTEDTAHRYPVVYFLHGYTSTAEDSVDFLDLPNAANGARELIVVIPDAYTIYSGSMYSSSPTTGDWEGYVARDLVTYVDEHYRTLPSPDSRASLGTRWAATARFGSA